MTDKQYEKFRKSGKKIFKVYLKGNRFHEEEVSVEDFDKSWILREWLNSCNPYDCEKQVTIRYVTEDQLENQIRKYHQMLHAEISDEISRLTKDLDRLNKAIKTAVYSPNIRHLKKVKAS